MKQNTPLRMCMSCKEMKPKQDLIKVVKQKDNQVKLDLTGKMDGRGAYICKSNECILKLKKNRLINRAFKINVENDIYNKVEETYKQS